MLSAPISSVTSHGIILSVCFLLSTATEHIGCGVDYEYADAGRISIRSSTTSSIAVAWDMFHHDFLHNLFDLIVRYRPCRQAELRPKLERDPVTGTYLARYDMDEKHYAWKSISSYAQGFHSHYNWHNKNESPPTEMVVNLTNLRFPDTKYEFKLQRIEAGSASNKSARIVGRTNPAPPNVCVGCFLVLRTLRRENKRVVRVYWLSVGQKGYFCVFVYRGGRRGLSLVHTKVGLLERGSVDVTIGMEIHFFEFSSGNVEGLMKSTWNSTTFVPAEGDVLTWPLVAAANLTIGGNGSGFWKKPESFDFDFYTLLWYDKRNLRQDPNLSPIMDWTYIQGKETEIEFKVANLTDVPYAGWRLIGNKGISSTGIATNFSD